MKRLRSGFAGLAVVVLVALPTATESYPLDAYERTGIRRLKVYKDINEGRIAGNINLRPGATIPSSAIRLRMADVNESFDLGPDTPLDPDLQAAMDRIVARRHSSYHLAILDITDPASPRYAAVKPTQGYIPGSVGKLLVMTGLFNELAQLHPDDVAARQRILRETMVTADDWTQPNSHAVPVVNQDLTAVVHRRIQIGDTFSLWEWIDHMMSPSSNAAASMVWKQAILIDAFGADYPPTAEQQAEFFASTARADLTARAVRVIAEPLDAVGIDPEGLFLRTVFTGGARRHIPAGGSHATPRQLVRWMLKMEQGKVVDRWSSLEMKRLMYFTRRRYRYAFAPALDEAAVYFKSGSLYSCVQEEGFQCGQYRGNRQNLMHSVAIIESPANATAGTTQHVYLVSMMSNVLRVNSAGEHAAIAAAIHGVIEDQNP